MSNYKIFKAMLNLNLSIGNTINHQLSYRRKLQSKKDQKHNIYGLDGQLAA